MARTNVDHVHTQLDAILAQTSSVLAPVFAQLDWAEEEIDRAQERHPDRRDALFHAFALLVPTHDRMQQEFVYRSHCRELLDRVATDRCTRLATAAEVSAMLSVASQVAPLSTPAFGLYARMWASADLPPVQGFDDAAGQYEAIASSRIDELERWARNKLAVPDRVLGPVRCDGHHHGELVQCKFAQPSSSVLAPARESVKSRRHIELAVRRHRTR